MKKKKETTTAPDSNEVGIVAGGMQFSDELEISVVYDKYTKMVSVTLTDNMHHKTLTGVTKMEEVFKS